MNLPSAAEAKEKADGRNQPSAENEAKHFIHHQILQSSNCQSLISSLQSPITIYQLLLTTHQFPQSIRVERYLQNLKLPIPQRVLQRLREQRTDGDRARLARAFHAHRVERRERFAVRGFDARHVEAGGQVIIHERAVEQLPVFVVGEPFVKRVADALRHAAVNLPVENERIDDLAAIMRDQIFLDVDLHRLGIHLHDHRVDAARGCASFWTEIVGRLLPRLGARLDGSALGIRHARQFAQ